MHIHSLTFNPFLENTYLLYDDTGECVIVDPGCYGPQEERRLLETIQQMKLKPVLLLNTHCHIDHVFGNKFVAEQFNIPLAIHPDELPILNALAEYGRLFGVPTVPSPAPTAWLAPGESVRFGQTQLEVLFTPGHSPGHVTFHYVAGKQIISGDVLFRGSIGRTDLPGGDPTTLMKSIVDTLLPLGDEVQVYNGHGPMTTLGQERTRNPFILDYLRV